MPVPRPGHARVRSDYRSVPWQGALHIPTIDGLTAAADGFASPAVRAVRAGPASWSEDVKALWAVQAVYVVHRNGRQASSRVGGIAAPLGVSRVFMASPAPRRLRSYPPRAVESRPAPLAGPLSGGDLGDKTGPGPVLLRARQVAPKGDGRPRAAAAAPGCGQNPSSILDGSVRLPSLRGNGELRPLPARVPR